VRFLEGELGINATQDIERRKNSRRFYSLLSSSKIGYSVLQTIRFEERFLIGRGRSQKHIYNGVIYMEAKICD
jgi:hypothetical protein